VRYEGFFNHPTKLPGAQSAAMLETNSLMALEKFTLCIISIQPCRSKTGPREFQAGSQRKCLTNVKDVPKRSWININTLDYEGEIGLRLRLVKWALFDNF